MKEILTYTQAINKATEHLLETDPKVYVMGLGANYPNGLDGTMSDLGKRFPNRVYDMPCSENANTGMAVGMAVNGLKPIVHHGRIEFALHAMDQIITQAAKWEYMFGGNYPCNLVLRIAMGRQWGNGPQHTLNAKGLFLHPGLHVCCPSTPAQAYWMLRDAVRYAFGPTIFLESRWLYKTKQTVDMNSIGTSGYAVQHLRCGDRITLVGTGDATTECLKAASILETYGISADVFDIPVLTETGNFIFDPIQKSVDLTRLIVMVEQTPPISSIMPLIASYIATDRAEVGFLNTKDHPCPTATSQTRHYYANYREITRECALKLGTHIPALEEPTFQELNLPPTDNFDDLIQEPVYES